MNVILQRQAHAFTKSEYAAHPSPLKQVNFERINKLKIVIFVCVCVRLICKLRECFLFQIQFETHQFELPLY